MSFSFRRAEASHSLPAYVSFDILQLVALGVSIFTLLPPLFSASVHRMKTWFGLMIACVLYCISFLVLLGQQSGKEPSLAFCTFQAGLIYAAPPGIAAAALGFVIELCMRLYTALSPNREALTNKLPKRVIYLLLISPIAHEVVFWVCVFTGLSRPSSISRHTSGIYCRIDHALPTLLAGGSVIIFLLIMFGLEVYTVCILVKQHRQARSIRVSGSYFPMSLFIRTALYSVIAGFGMIIVTITINATSNETQKTALYTFAVIPLSVGLLFGTQLDILRTYFCFWRKKSSLYSRQITTNFV